MSESSEAGGAPEAVAQPGQRQVMLRIDDAGATSSYANAYNLFPSNEEITVDLAMRLPGRKVPTGQEGQTAEELRLKVEHRVVMNYATAKRLAGSLVQTIQKYEQAHGEIKINPQG